MNSHHLIRGNQRKQRKLHSTEETMPITESSFMITSKKDRDNKSGERTDGTAEDKESHSSITTRSSSKKINTKNKGENVKNNKGRGKSINTRELNKKRNPPGANSSSEDEDGSEAEEESEDDFIVNDKGGNSPEDAEYKKFLNEMFPSKYMKKKAKKASSQKNNNIIKTSTKNKKNANNHKNKKEVVEDEDDSDYQTEGSGNSEGEEDSDDGEYDTEDDDSEEEYYVKSAKKGKNGINLILSISDPNEYETDYSEEDEYSSNSSDGSSEEDDSSEDDSDNSDKEERLKNRLKKEEELRSDSLIAQKEIKTIQSLKEPYLKILESDKDNEIALEGLKALEKKEANIKKNIHKKEKKQKTKNTRRYKSVVNKKNMMNDYKYFKKKLTLEEQKKVIEEVNVINKIDIVQKPYRISLLESSIPPYLKAIAMSKISLLRHMEPGNGEFFKVKTWVDTFMKIPFNIYRSLPLSMSDGVEKCHDYMEKSKTVLDEAVFGLNDAKMQIMQLIGQWISNPKAMGTSIAIKGPMGTGKTTLVKDGISKILNREFAFLALGGATDSSVLEGHGYTYEGSTWGKVVDILIQSKSMNPVIYFDELDKISDTPKGEEIAGILTHLTDTSQNSLFHDKYFSEIEFDLSKCLFIFSYNDEKKVNPILLDRMYKIQTKGYDKKEKTVIATKYLIPKIIEQVNFAEGEIIIPNETIEYIIENYTEKEDGVRNLKRCLEIVYTKLNMYRLMKPESSLFDGEVAFKVEYPFTVSVETLTKLIKRKDLMSHSLYMMYM